MSQYIYHTFRALENEHNDMTQINKPIKIDIPGVGNCNYSGDWLCLDERISVQIGEEMKIQIKNFISGSALLKEGYDKNEHSN